MWMGWEFHPSDEEKIAFLYKKVTGQPLPENALIRTEDLYGEKEPWEIVGDSKEKELFFFSKLKKVGKNTANRGDQRYSRNVAKGTWMNKGKKVPICKKKQLIGFKRCFRYENKKASNTQKDMWLLKEYILSDEVSRCLKDDEKKEDYAFCVLKKKSSGKEADSGYDQENGAGNYFLDILPESCRSSFANAVPQLEKVVEENNVLEQTQVENRMPTSFGGENGSLYSERSVLDNMLEHKSADASATRDSNQASQVHSVNQIVLDAINVESWSPQHDEENSSFDPWSFADDLFEENGTIRLLDNCFLHPANQKSIGTMENSMPASEDMDIELGGLSGINDESGSLHAC